VRYFLDTEFMEDGRTVDILSLGLVAEDGRELYVVNSEADHSKANEWVQENVIPHLHDDVGHGIIKLNWGRELTKAAVLDLVNGDPKPQFWGYYADYDWVAFCQLFGTMMHLPKGFPMYCRDIKQLCDMLGNPRLPEQGKGEHHALLDARWNKQAWEFLGRFAGDAYGADANDGVHQLIQDIFSR
jgi:3' exoribonuclease, RNase T-like